MKKKKQKNSHRHHVTKRMSGERNVVELKETHSHLRYCLAGRVAAVVVVAISATKVRRTEK
jgi:hypothetical protein